jgi:hypothetical protein
MNLERFQDQLACALGLGGTSCLSDTARSLGIVLFSG